MEEVKDNNADGVLDAGERVSDVSGASGVDGYYGEDMDMGGDLDLSFLDDDKDEPRDHDSYDD